MGETRFPPWFVVNGKPRSERGGRLRRPGALARVGVVLNTTRGHTGETGFPPCSFPHGSIADVNVVVVVGQREGRSAEPEEGDDLLRHQLGR